MAAFFFYKIGRHFVLSGTSKAPRYRVTWMRRNNVDVLQTGSTTVTLPFRVPAKRKLVVIVAKTREEVIEWLKTQKWSEL
ncbi:MAG: hypothetical protein MJZ81_10815 [Bacteroidales bacterium]|nr:hypothetical protein [Bacteroidales bacterium]